MDSNLPQKPYFVYFGTYTMKVGHVDGKAEGIYVYRMDPDSGALESVTKISGVVNPSFLAIHPNGSYLYAVNELRTYAGQPGGAVSAFAINPQTGGLKFLNKQYSNGADPCHVCLDATGKYVLVSNYSSGSLAVYPVKPDGRLGDVSDIVQHHGKSIDPQRQEGPHAHSVTIDPTNRYAFVADLGMDKVMIYRLDLVHGRLVHNAIAWVPVKGGAGPRHMEFHPNGRFAYLINELDATIIAFAYESDPGTLRELQTVPTLPQDYSGFNGCADIHITPAGKFLYGSNRGHDSLVIYAVDEYSGALTFVGHEPTQGKTPRNFAIDPSGTFLLVANQDSSNIVTYKIDPQTGKLQATGQITQVPTPVCIKFLK